MPTPIEGNLENNIVESGPQLIGFRKQGAEQISVAISAEQSEKIPEFEIENYKIDRELSIDEKLNNGRTKEIDFRGRDLLQKDLGNNAYIWEILEGGDEAYTGEQKFNREAVRSLGLTDRLVKDDKEFFKIRGQKNHEFMQKYFYKKNKTILSGFFTPANKFKHFHDLGVYEYCWLGDGNSVSLDENGCCQSLHDGHVGCSPRFGLSVRLIKNLD